LSDRGEAGDDPQRNANGSTASLVNAPISEAFRAFTERFGDFKPREHNLLPAGIEETVFEPRVGGHVYDRAVDDSECRWARILLYDPPDRVLFSWDISPRWQLETNLDLASEVEVRFFKEPPERTRGELEHRGWDAGSSMQRSRVRMRSVP
jgi:hypothetical protein